MEKSAPYFIVGLFMTLAVFAFVWFLIWMAGPDDKEDYHFYTVEFKDSISGLEEGSNVEYKGVKVGKVMKMHLVPGDTELVRVDIGVDKRTPVRGHTKVALQIQGITGLVRIEMSTDNNDVTIPERRPGMPYPVLQGQGSQLYQVLEDLPAITKQIAEIAGKVNAIITRNRVHLDRFAAQGLPQVTAASQEMKKTAVSVQKLSDKLNEDPSQILYRPSAHGVEIPP